MKEINYDNCMKRKCEQCKYYDKCFKKGKNNERNNSIKQNKQNIRKHKL